MSTFAQTGCEVRLHRPNKSVELQIGFRAYNWCAVVKSGNQQNDFEQRRGALVSERATIAIEIARLLARDEQLVRHDERLRMEAEALVEEPYLVGAQWLIAKLSVSNSGLWRLVRNPAKGFPEPVYIDSDPRWKWPEVAAWLEKRNDRAGTSEMAT